MIYYWYNFILHFYTCMDRPHTSWPHIGIVDMADPRTDKGKVLPATGKPRTQRWNFKASLGKFQHGMSCINTDGEITNKCWGCYCHFDCLHLHGVVTERHFKWKHHMILFKHLGGDITKNMLIWTGKACMDITNFDYITI